MASDRTPGSSLDARSDSGSGNGSGLGSDSGRDFAVICYREEGRWELGLLPQRASSSLESLLAVLRQQPGELGTVGFVDIADDFFVAARVTGDDVRLLLSDITAADEWPLAREVLEWLGIPEPTDEDLDDVVPAGDLALFTDLGLPEIELGLMLSDIDAYADEMLFSIARRLGFGDDLERLVDAGVQ
jgi:putative tRNA adenosine deaminase-associated protein